MFETWSINRKHEFMMNMLVRKILRKAPETGTEQEPRELYKFLIWYGILRGEYYSDWGIRLEGRNETR
jgi:hypothetical protein